MFIVAAPPSVRQGGNFLMSDTPRTDSILESTWHSVNMPTNPIPAEFARKLELELAAVMAERDEYRGLLIELYNDINIIHSGKSVAKLNSLMRDENYN